MDNLYKEAGKAAEIGDAWESILVHIDIRAPDQGGNRAVCSKANSSNKKNVLISYVM